MQLRIYSLTQLKEVVAECQETESKLLRMCVDESIMYGERDDSYGNWSTGRQWRQSEDDWTGSRVSDATKITEDRML